MFSNFIVAQNVTILVTDATEMDLTCVYHARMITSRKENFVSTAKLARRKKVSMSLVTQLILDSVWQLVSSSATTSTLLQSLV